MDQAFQGKRVIKYRQGRENPVGKATHLASAQLNTPYWITGVQTEDEDMQDFLFSLGCYEGQTVTILSALGENFVISVKDARYSIDRDLAEAILV
ncbi:MAG: ferrous iron transport protein A [Turicibacter sp.]|nr:ferrous iron transport protein A [Turicibacter sp.]